MVYANVSMEHCLGSFNGLSVHQIGRSGSTTPTLQVFCFLSCSQISPVLRYLGRFDFQDITRLYFLALQQGIALLVMSALYRHNCHDQNCFGQSWKSCTILVQVKFCVT